MFAQLCNINLLHSAWKTVKTKNSAGGVDGLSLLEFENNLQRNLNLLLAELKNRKWLPAPYLKIEIPKKTGEKRVLGLLTVKDKIVQTAIKSLIEPRFEKMFLSCSYGYRPGKGTLKAIRRTINEFRNPKNLWVAQMDIDNYFDTVNHDILFARLTGIICDDEILRLIELSVKMGMVTKSMKWQNVKSGVHQGAILSPLLANFYLHPFDQCVTAKVGSYVRYADDFLLFAESKEQIDLLVETASNYLETKLLLKLNPATVQETTQAIEFLGVMVDKKTVSVSGKKLATLTDRIRSLRWEHDGLTSDSIETLSGISRYYAKILPKDILLILDEELKSTITNLIIGSIKIIAGKKQLAATLKQIEFFTPETELQKMTIFGELLTKYSELKGKQSDDNQKKNQKLINQKKIEYQRLEAECSELLVSSVGSFIGISQNKIRVKVQGREMKIPPPNALKHITVLTRAASVSAEAVYYCVGNHIPIDFFDGKGHCYASIIKPVSIEQKLWQQQAEMPNERKAELASRILLGKIKNQLYLLKYFHKYHKNNELSEQVNVGGEKNVSNLTNCYQNSENKMNTILEELKKYRSDDSGYQEELIALEAQSAVAYWEYIRNLLSDDNVDFERRERQGATDLFNSMLNYGYAILYPRIWQALLAVKLNPGISVLHKPQTDKPTLVYDLIEIFRAQAVDRVVISLIQKSEPLAMDKNLLNEDTRKLLIKNILERLNRYEKFRGEECRFEEIIRKQAHDLAAYISGESKNFKPYIAKW
jgi:group II intron reverse transcriptase/maturase/CRISPR-associated endonuclease Cas1